MRRFWIDLCVGFVPGRSLGSLRDRRSHAAALVCQYRLSDRRKCVLASAFLARMSILQPINARMRLKCRNAFGGGIADTSSSRLLGRLEAERRPQRDDRRLHPARKRRQSMDHHGEFETIGQNWRGLPGSRLSRRRSQFELELPSGRTPPQSSVYTSREPTRNSAEGLLGNLMLPIFDDIVSIADRCAAWNLTDSLWTDIPQFGCWYPRCGRRCACPHFHRLFRTPYTDRG